MSNTATKLIQDLILFYVKENYNHYLTKNDIKKIPDDKIKGVVTSIYSDKKDHLREFLKGSLKELMKDDYIGDLALLNICNEIFEDDELCINRLTLEIKNFQDDN
tara:strand:- start:11448 stop:11762 length:315 start_codon:yes stop_codon:yes gene_type:complete